MSEDRKRLLLAYARAVIPERAVEEAAGAGVPGLESVPAEAADVLEHLHGDASRLGRDHLDALEAIILPRHRPPLIVRNGSYDEPPPPWVHLDQEATRDVLRPAIAAVGRVEVPNLDLPYGGTAFLVGPDLLMTNWHVARLFVRGSGTRDLLYTPGDAEIDFAREVSSPAPRPLEVREPVMIHPHWDMALLRLAAPLPGVAPLTFSLVHPDDLVENEVAVIGYPTLDPRNNVAVQDEVFGGVYGVKRLQPGLVGTAREVATSRNRVRALTHDASTLGGNSGSVVLDLKSGHVVGLHFAGRYLDANFAVPAHALGQDSRVVDTGLRFAGTAPGGDPHPRAWADADPQEPPSDVAMPGATTVVTRVAAEGVEVEVPITVTVRVGGDVGAAGAPPVRAEERPAEDLGDRRGYDPEFLPGHAIPLPELHPSHLDDVVEDATAPDAERDHSLDYEHFSVCMSRSRRLARFTAVNVHGGRLVQITRTSDSWSFDPRIAASLQLGNALYRDNDLDRGHLVRRIDPVWGTTPEEAQRANDDTFHYTNSAPQHKDLNRNRGTWQGVEQYVYDLAAKNHLRVSVFTGPVFRDTDRSHRGVPVPEEFWKVVAFVHEDGRLSTSAFLLSQRDLIDDLTEAIPGPGKWAAFQVAVAFVERLTQLHFHQLRHHDVLTAVEEGAQVGAGAVRRITPATPPILTPEAAVEEGVLDRTWAKVVASVMRPLAKAYNLRKKGENRYFNTQWRMVTALARFDLSKKAKAAHRETAFRMVDAAGVLLKEAIDGRPSDVLGHRHVKRLPVGGRYVIFSDHHITHSKHRQNFFWKSGNHELYAKVLDQYFETDFSLIENGDVEELLIWDPQQYPAFIQERMGWGDIFDKEYETELPAKLIEQRLAVRFHLLDDILTDEALEPWRTAVQRFDRDERLYRVAGNHDYNLQGKAFLERFQQVFPNVEQVYDYVLLERDDGHVDYAIMHGHQFDLTTNPASAPRFGETFSECIALWFQGGDRTWGWGDDDSQPGEDLYVAEPDDWAAGKVPFDNELVEDIHEAWNPEFPEPPPEGPLDLPPGMDHVGDDLDLVLLRVMGRQLEESIPVLDEEEEVVGEELTVLGRDTWQEVFGHAVAWEYFAHDDPTSAILNEVFCGKRFFKYRHTNEQELARQLMLNFDEASRPTVILGHTHEPRIDSAIPTAFIERLRASGRPGDDEVADELSTMERFTWYANSAAAGRFERLIWAIEVDAGVMRLVSWARTDSGAVERRVWNTTAEGVQAQGTGHTPIPGGG